MDNQFILPTDLMNIVLDYKNDMEKLSNCISCNDEYNPIDLDGRNDCEKICGDCYCDFCECNKDDCECCECDCCEERNDTDCMFFCEGCEGSYCSCMGINGDYVQINNEHNYCKNCIFDKLKIQEKNEEYTFFLEGEEISGEDIRTIMIDNGYHWISKIYDIINEFDIEEIEEEESDEETDEE
tara:strand:+ start:232 stop:780 length:549 start_codon:yes stop_codon:yes gene_type:complete